MPDQKLRNPPVSFPALEAMYYGIPMRQDVATAREPSARELLAEKLQSQFERFMPKESAKKGARKITGYTYPMGVADITPAGIPLWAYEGGESLAKAAQAAGEGEYGTAALEGLMGALGVAPAAPAVGALGKAAGKGVAGQIERAMMTGEGPLGTALAAVRPQFAIAYHGTPHKFEKFDISKIGTGEGAQAYGHGLYFAEAPGVAQSYKTAGSDIAHSRVTGGLTPMEEYAVDMAAQGKRGEDLFSAMHQRYGKTLKTDADFDAFDQAIKKAEQSAGNLYKVDIPDEAVARMLDWDKPLSEQPEILKRTGPHGKEFTFRNELERLGLDPSVTGADLLQMGYGSGRSGQKAQEVSSYLNKWGIPGIKYLDEGSRAAGEGTRNFVLFSDELPRILEINDKPTGAQPWAPGEWGRAPFQYPQAEALETARKNAVTMLGLPENNTAMDRARAMGGVDVYHGTKQDVTGGFKPVYEDQLVFTTPSPEFASNWIGKGAMQKRVGDAAEAERQAAYSKYKQIREEIMDPESLNLYKDDAFTAEYDRRAALFREAAAREGVSRMDESIHGNVLPLRARISKTFVPAKDFSVMDDYIKSAFPEANEPLYEMFKKGDYLVYENPNVVKYLKDRGYDSMLLRESTSQPDSTLAIFDPSRVRSRFAAFDPARINENDLLGYARPEILPYLAGVGALGGLGLAAIKDEPKGKKNGK